MSRRRLQDPEVRARLNKLNRERVEEKIKHHEQQMGESFVSIQASTYEFRKAMQDLGTSMKEVIDAITRDDQEGCMMPLVHGTRTRRDGTLYRALLLSEDGRRQTPLGVAYTMDQLKEVIQRNAEKNPGRVVVETAEVPEDMQWRELRRV